MARDVDAIFVDDEPTPRQAILPELRSSLAAAKITPLDSATAAIALRYAQLLDECAVEKQYVKPLEMLGQAVTSYADNLPIAAADQLMGALAKVTSALAEHTTASDLGPKLLTTLTALNLTTAAREKGKPRTGSSGDVIPMANPLAVARDQARARREAAETA